MSPAKTPDFQPPQQDPAAAQTPSGAATPGVGATPAGTPGVASSSHRGRSATRLPWAVAATLGALSLVLATLLASQTSELHRLRNQVATPAAQPATAQPVGATMTPTAQPTQDPRAVEAMKKLPRRVANDPLALGAVNAPVTIVAWSDFRCPFCSVWARQTLPQLQPYIDSGSLRIEHRDLVLFGDESEQTAIAARAAGRQGRFWQFYQAVHDVAPTNGHPEIGAADLTAFAKKAGVADMTRFAQDLKDPALKKLVDADTQQARQLGLTATPFFVINTTPMAGAQPASVFIQSIEGYGAHK